METTELSVGGMTCGGCEASIKRALERVDGVIVVTASHESGSVIVDSDPPVERARIVEAIEGAGYEVLPEGRERLPLLGG